MLEDSSFPMTLMIPYRMTFWPDSSAQSQVENIPLITIDHLIVQYPVQTIW
jgi:hypothetical protein